jgi:hypothetical protein
MTRVAIAVSTFDVPPRSAFDLSDRRIETVTCVTAKSAKEAAFCAKLEKRCGKLNRLLPRARRFRRFDVAVAAPTQRKTCAVVGGTHAESAQEDAAHAIFVTEA